MTEQQFEKIKSLLDKSQTLESSSELDALILDSAAQQADLNKQLVTDDQASVYSFKAILVWLRRLSQGGVAQAAVLSLVFTLAVFAGMAQLLKTDKALLVAGTEETMLEFEANPVVSITERQVTKPIKPELEFTMPETQFGRDQILASMSLPDIQSLLSEIVQPVNGDREFAKSQITIAMADIGLLLNDGKYDGARIRYAQLKEHCLECALPESLEALVAFSTGFSQST